MNPAPPVTRVFMPSLLSNPYREPFAVEVAAASHHLAVADHAAAQDLCALRHHGALPDHRSVDHRGRAHANVGQQHRVLDPGAIGHDGTGADDRTLDGGIGTDVRIRVDAVDRGAPHAVDEVELGLDVLAG